MELERGTIRDYSAGDHTATVEVDGSDLSYVSGVPVSRCIAAVEVVAGRACFVAWVGTGDVDEMMVLGVY